MTASRTTIITFIAFVLALVAQTTQAGIIFDGSFETGKYATSGDLQPNRFWVGAMGPNCVPNNQTNSATNDNKVVSSPTVGPSSKYAAELTIRYNCDYRTYNGGTAANLNTGLQKPRQELGVPPDLLLLQTNQVYKLAFSVMVPSDYIFDYEAQDWQMFEAFKMNNRNATATGAPQTNGGGAFYFSVHGTNMKWITNNIHSGSTLITDSAQKSQDIPIVRGQWSHIAVDFRLCNVGQAGCTGYVKLYHNGTLIREWNGANTTATEGHKIKWGIYKHSWHCKLYDDNYTGSYSNPQQDWNYCMATAGGPHPHPTLNTGTVKTYVDEIRLGDANSTLAEVQPHVFGANSGNTGGATPAFTGDFESGQVNSNGSAVDGFLVQTFNGSTYVGVTGGGAGPASGYDTRVVASESVGGSTVTPRKGAYFMRSEIIRSKNYTTYNGNGGLDKPRSNIAMSDPGLRTDFDDENWLGFSVFLPSNFVHDTGTLDGGQGNQIFTNYATSTGSTQFTIIEYVPTGDTVSHWFLQYYTDPSSTTESVGTRTTVDLGPVTGDLGKWTDFVIRYRMNPFTTATNASTVTNGMNKVFEGNKGILQVWKASGAVDGNGNRTMTKVVDIVNAPVGLVPHASNKMVNALRLYKYHWKTNTTANTGTVWAGFDEIKAGRAADGVTYNSVYPGTVPCTSGCGGTGGTGSDPTIIRTNLENPIPENTPAAITDNAIGFTTTGETNGVMSVDFTDGVNTVPTELFNGNITGGGYITGDLSSLNQSSNLRVRYDQANIIFDTEGAESFDTWSEDGMTITPVYPSPLYEAPDTSTRNSNFGILKGYSMVNGSAAYKSHNSPTQIGLPDNTTLTIQCLVKPGSSGRFRLRAVQKISGALTYNVISGVLGSLSTSAYAAWGQDHAFKQTQKFGIHQIEYSVTTTAATGDYYFTLGADSNVLNAGVTPLRCIGWKNPAPKTMTLPVTLARADVTAPNPGPCTINKHAGTATVACELDDPTGNVCAAIYDSSADQAAEAVKAGTGALWHSCSAVNSYSYGATTPLLDVQKDWHLKVVHTDLSDNDSVVTTADDFVPAEPAINKVLKLGTPLSKITRNGVPATFTYTSVKVYDKNPATDRTAQVLVELVGPYDEVLQEYEGISVVNGIASATEADVLVGSGSLNALDDGTYWVLSSRPSNGTLAISLTNRQLITE